MAAAQCLTASRTFPRMIASDPQRCVTYVGSAGGGPGIVLMKRRFSGVKEFA